MQPYFYPSPELAPALQVLVRHLAAVVGGAAPLCPGKLDTLHPGQTAGCCVQTESTHRTATTAAPHRCCSSPSRLAPSPAALPSWAPSPPNIKHCPSVGWVLRGCQMPQEPRLCQHLPPVTETELPLTRECRRWGWERTAHTTPPKEPVTQHQPGTAQDLIFSLILTIPMGEDRADFLPASTAVPGVGLSPANSTASFR